MSDTIKRARELLEFDDRAKTLEAEFRYACYPDADKDQLATLLADYACHGFASGVGVKFDRVRPMIEAALEVVAEARVMIIAAEQSRIMFALTNGASGTSTTAHYGDLAEKLARFAKAVEGEK